MYIDKSKIDVDKKFRFRNFPVYVDARRICYEIKTELKDSFPDYEKFGLKTQPFRALDSSLLNIAEGSERKTDIDFARFLNNASASINECVACLDSMLDQKFIDENFHEEFLYKLAHLANQLTAFRQSILKD